MSNLSRLARAVQVAAAVGIGSAADAQIYMPPDAIYVDAAAPIGGDGTSWSAALRDLQDALELLVDYYQVHGENPPIIKIAGGVYTPDRGTLDRTRSFTLTSMVTLWGGYAGIRFAEPDKNDPAAFTTVLSGDLRHDDGPDFANTGDNSLHVVRACGSMSTLSNLVIRAGNADGPGDDGLGGGLTATICGGGVYILNCRLTGNRAVRGGGMAIATYSVILNSIIDGNIATDGGGGIWTDGGPRLERCMIAGNTALGSAPGGGIASSFRLTLLDSVVQSNRGGEGAGLWLARSGEIDGCTIVANTNAGSGGGLYVAAGQGNGIRLRNSIAWGNQAAAGSQIAIEPGATKLAVARCDVQGGLSAVATPPGLLDWNEATMLDADPMFVLAWGQDGDPGTWSDNDLRLQASSPCVDGGDAIRLRQPWYPSRLDVTDRERYINADRDALAQIDLGAYEAPARPRPAPVTLYVRAGAAPGGDGRSWATAFDSPMAALRVPGIRELWLTSGTFRMHPTDRSAALELQDCTVAIRGGFRGDETAPSQRDPAAPPTILSGDLAGNDGPGFTHRDDNSEQLLRIANADVELDRLWVQGAAGKPDSLYGTSHGAVLASRSHITLRDCRFAANLSGVESPLWTQAKGAAIALGDGSLTATDCLFEDNLVSATGPASGAAIEAYGPVRMERCAFLRNRVEGRSWSGGGAIHVSSPLLRLRSCTFIGNSATQSEGGSSVTGGAIVSWTESTDVVNCRFRGNRAEASGAGSWASGGAMALGAVGHTAITGTEFSGNTAVDPAGFAAGGAIYASYGKFFLSACTIVNNRAEARGGRGGGVLMTWYVPSHISNTLFWGNSAPEGDVADTQFSASQALFRPQIDRCLIQGTAEWPLAQGPRLLNPLGPDGIAGTDDDDLRPRVGSPCIDAGDAGLLPPDLLDSDGDSDTAEPLPLDAAGRRRVVRSRPGSSGTVDIGAYEFQTPLCAADWDASGRVDILDLSSFIADWHASVIGGTLAGDVDGNGAADAADVSSFVATWMRAAADPNC